MVIVKEKPKAALEPPPRELSPTRVVVFVLFLLLIGAGAWTLISKETPAAAKSNAVPVYSPYVDVTQTPTYPFQLPSSNPVSSVYLSFIVSDKEEPCTPSWGTYYTLESAQQGLDLDSRTAQLRAQGGTVNISYGGQANTELAVDCTDPTKLEQAYLEPIERYHAKSIDLDIEGANLANTAANARRATAIAAVQKQLRAEKKPPVSVWMTLPVSSHGLTAEGIAATQAMLKGGVTLAGVNAMTMDFGPGEGAEKDMLGTIEKALDATQAQVQNLWRAAGLPSGAGAAWGHVGVTPMLGVNDVTAQRFTTKDAKGLAEFIEKHGISRASAWSLNRDQQCGGAFAKVGELSDTCSGVEQKPLEFTRIFSGLRGTKTAHREAAEASAAAQTHSAPITDDPATSPYPIWRPAAAYNAGYKVVWQGQIYQAGWWNQGTSPGTAAADSPNGPWQPIGPVPPGSTAPQLVKTDSASHPNWSPSRVYHEGDRVRFKGMPYRARWYTQGEQPLAELPPNPSQPWEPLFKYPGEPSSGEEPR